MRVIALLIVATAALPASSRAQTPAAPQSSDQQTPPRAGQPPPPVDASRLGVSFDRIKRELAQAQAGDEQLHDNAMKLSFTVQVVGQAPKIELLQGFSLNGAIPYGAPTHREILDVVTPQAYRSPALPISALTSWAAQKLWQKTKKERCEEEIRSYKAMVMSGVSVSAPTCTQ